MSAQELCLKLMKLDNEDEVIEALRVAGYWDEPEYWRDFGDNENNFSTAGAQQSDATAAFVEKIINSIDARLMNEVLMNGVNPKSPSAPKSVQDAVAKYLITGDKHGVIKNWTAKEKEDHAAKIAVVATGSKSRPSFTIVDQGEGQTPSNIPHTFMSLNKSNKLNIPFVQGKFNMGGTGVFRFCGERSIQLLITRRNPKLIDGGNPDDCKWGFTVVRRDPPRGSERSSVFRYLAPVDEGRERRGVLRFSADSLRLFPIQDEPYSRYTEYGSLIKLYNYKVRQRSNILIEHGLRNAVDVRLPSPALPVRFHETRNYSRRATSEILVGILLKLHDRQDDALEAGFPIHSGLTVDGQKFNLSVYGFKPNQAGSYFTATDGVLFSVNGQTHGKLAQRFFRKKRVRLDYVAESLLVHVDCSDIDAKHQEELFMNSRDRLADSPFRRDLETRIEEYLGSNGKLKRFAEYRRDEMLRARIKDDKSFGDIMNKIIGQSPSLANLLGRGRHLVDPTVHNPDPKAQGTFEGRPFPSYFKFRKKRQGDILQRQCEQGRATRIVFETDAENDYFFRPKDEGQSKLVCTRQETGETIEIVDHDIDLTDGLATLKIKLPEEITVGESVSVRLEVSDITQIDPFINLAELDVIPKQEKPPSPPTGPGTGDGNASGAGKKKLSSIDLPQVHWVKESEWGTPPATENFTKKSAVAITARSNNQGRQLYDFFLNEDNIFLKNELRKSDKTADLIKEQYRIGMVLVGMSLIKNSPEHEDGVDLEKTVAETTEALAMIIVPIIRDISNIDLDDVSSEDDTDLGE